MHRKSHKTVLITGVSRGLGRAMAEKFAALGHTVLGCARSKKQIVALQSLLPEPHHFSVLDVTDDGAVQGWSRELFKKHPAPEILINNAALINRNAKLWQVPAEEFSQVIDVNVKGVANILRHFLPEMVRLKRGVIVNFSSGWGRSTDAEVAPYCATKWAIEGLTQALALELPSGMAAVPLNPGVINTEMLQSCFGGSARSYPEAREWAERAVPFILEIGPGQNGQALSV